MSWGSPGEVPPPGAWAFEQKRSQLKPTWQTGPTFELRQLERVPAPTLVLVADDDVVVNSSTALRSSELCRTPSSPWYFLASEQVPKLFG